MTQINNENLQTIKFPNGIAVVPKDITPEVLKDFSISQGYATQAFWDAANVSVTSEPEELFGAGAGRMVRKVGQAAVENPDISLSTAGSFLGGAVGAFGGPVGIAVGSTVGSALGDFAGTLIKQGYGEEDVDFMEATYSALMGAGIDLATLKLGKYIDPLIPLAKKKLGFSPEEAADQIENLIKSDIPKTPFAGEPESLRKTQELLQQRGATLTRSQAGVATPFDKIAENIGSAGIFSGNVIEGAEQQVNRAVQQTLEEVIGNPKFEVGSADLGLVISEVIEAGRKAGNEVYGLRLKEISELVGNQMVDTRFIFNQINSYVQSQQRTAAQPFSLLATPAKNYIEKELLQVFFDGTNTKIGASNLLEIDRLIGNKINDFTKAAKTEAGGFDQSIIQLTELRDKIRTGIIDTLNQVDPKAGTKYKQMQAEYKKHIENLLPNVSKSFIRNANKGSYEQLGNFLTKIDADSEAFKQFYRSIDQSFSTLKKAPLATASRTGDKGVIQSAEEAKKLISQGYLTSLIPDFSSKAFDINQYAKLAETFNDPSKNATLFQVLNRSKTDYKKVKQLFNTMSEASKNPDGNIATLLLRAKEYGVPQTLGALIVPSAAGAAASAGDVATAMGILTIPYVFAKMATNPKAVNKLVAFEKQNFATEDKRNLAINIILGDVIDGMTQEEQAELRNFVRGTNEPVQ